MLGRWGLAYKIVCDKLRIPKQLNIKNGMMVRITNKVLPKVETIRQWYPCVLLDSIKLYRSVMKK